MWAELFFNVEFSDADAASFFFFYCAKEVESRANFAINITKGALLLLLERGELKWEKERKKKKQDTTPQQQRASERKKFRAQLLEKGKRKEDDVTIPSRFFNHFFFKNFFLKKKGGEEEEEEDLRCDMCITVLEYVMSSRLLPFGLWVNFFFFSFFLTMSFFYLF